MIRSVLMHRHLDEDVLARLRHVNRRLEQFYALHLSAAEFMGLCRGITERTAPYHVLRRDKQGRQIVRLTLKGMDVLLVYSPTRGLIHTALHPGRGLEAKRRTRLRPRRVSRRHAYAQRGQGGHFKHPECALAAVQGSRPLGAAVKRR